MNDRCLRERFRIVFLGIFTFTVVDRNGCRGIPKFFELVHKSLFILLWSLLISNCWFRVQHSTMPCRKMFVRGVGVPKICTQRGDYACEKFLSDSERWRDLGCMCKCRKLCLNCLDKNFPFNYLVFN